MKTAIIYAFLFFFFIGCAYSQTELTNRVYKIWDDQPAPNKGSDFNDVRARGYPHDEDWMSKSYPIGNGYMGANLFGRTDTDRIQITEKTLYNEGLYGIGGLTNFAEIYLDINHQDPQDYSRILNLNEAVFYVNYKNAGVEYSREYFMSYPDNILVIKLSANKKGKVSFTLRPENPYLRDSTQINAKSGKVVAQNDLITMSGHVNHFGINYETQIKVVNDGGSLSAVNDGDKGKIIVSHANSVVLLVATGTNYKLSEKVFIEEINNKKLDKSITPHIAVSELIKSASDKGFAKLKETHLDDYQNLFSRVQLNLNGEVPEETTNSLLERYKENDKNLYLEELMFQYGRYLLIASSRKGTLPTGLQGIWSASQVTPFTGGYWHNINVQMNYWGALNTNLAETFTPYIEFFKAYLPEARILATKYIQQNNPALLSQDSTDNGWTIGTGATPYIIQSPGGHSGPGTGGLTGILFWDYYDFTRDTTYLREIGYPAILGMSKFLSKTLKPSKDGLLLVDPSASPEQKYKGDNYTTKGTTFDQSLVWENHSDLLKASAVLGKEDDFLELVKDQLPKLDPIIIGKSGQIKEYREENFYSDIGDPHHRHISHLFALYPGTLINSCTKEWMAASVVTLDLRGNKAGGWATAYRMLCRARTKDGEMAHELYERFIKVHVMPNLWSTHSLFQIDGNFGVMAGVAEMLLQSQEGYIEPLPALPDVWENGEYKGLVARGNFVISAAWKRGKASSFEITSNSGGLCRIKYPGIVNVQITDASGITIPHNKDTSDIISFETKKGKSYFISL